MRVLECELCGRACEEIVKCKNADWCRNGRCRVCFIALLQRPDVHDKVFDTKFTCESCAVFGGKCIAKLGPGVAAASQAAAPKPRGRPPSSTKAKQQQKRGIDAAGASDAAPVTKKPKPAAASEAAPSPAAAAAVAAAADKLTAKTAAKQPPPAPTAERPAAKRPAEQAPSAAAEAACADQPAAKRQEQGPGLPSSPAAGTPGSSKPAAAAAAASARLRAGVKQSIEQQRKQEHDGSASRSNTFVSASQSDAAARLAKAALARKAAAAAVPSGTGASTGSRAQQQQQQAKQPASAAAVGAKAAQQPLKEKRKVQQLPEKQQTKAQQRQQTKAQQERQQPDVEARERQKQAELERKQAEKSEKLREMERRLAERAASHAATSAAAGRLAVGSSQQRQQLSAAGTNTAASSEQRPAAGSGGGGGGGSTAAAATGGSVAAAAAGGGVVGDKEAMKRRAEQRRQAYAAAATQQKPAPGKAAAATGAAGRPASASQPASSRPLLKGSGGSGDVASALASAAVAKGAAAGAAAANHVKQDAKPLQPKRSFQLVKALDSITPHGQAAEDENTEEEAEAHRPQRDPHASAAAATTRPVLPAARAHVGGGGSLWSGSLNVSSGDNFYAVDVRVMVSRTPRGAEVPPLLQTHEGDLEGDTMVRKVMDKIMKEDGSGPLEPCFARSNVLLKERAIGQSKMMPMLIADMVRNNKYVRVRENRQIMFLSPVLKQQDGKVADGTLLDFETRKVTLDDDEVYMDRLAVLFYLLPGEELAFSAVGFAEPSSTAVLAAPRPAAAGGWDPTRQAAKPSLKHNNSGALQQAWTGKAAAAAAALVAASKPPAGSGSLFGEEDDYDFLQDDLAEEQVGGGLGAGMMAGGTGAAAGGFMAGPHFEDQGPGSSTMGDNMTVGFVGFAPTDGQAVHPLLVCGAPRLPAASQQPAVPDWQAVQAQHNSEAEPRAGTAGPSPTVETPEHEAQPSEHDRLRLFNSAPLAKAVVKMRHASTPGRSPMPSLSSLLTAVNNHHSLGGLRVHFDGSYMKNHLSQAKSLMGWVQSKGAIVTCYNVEKQPSQQQQPPGAAVDVLLVGKKHVRRDGLEGPSGFLTLSEYLLEGTHVVDEGFFYELQRTLAEKGTLTCTPGSSPSWQVYAGGCVLLWDETLLRHAPSSKLAELVQSVRDVRDFMARDIYRAGCAWLCYVRAAYKQASCQAEPQLLRLFKQWSMDGLVKDLPPAFESKSPTVPYEISIRDAVKVAFNMNKGVLAPDLAGIRPLRYAVVVLPDYSSDMPKAHADMVLSILNTAHNQKTVLAATLSQVVSFMQTLQLSSQNA